MKLVVIPDQARWVEPLLATLGAEDLVVAPWAVNSGPRWLRERFAHRHLPTAAQVVSLPGWPVVERVVHSVSGRLLRRVAIDGLVAWWLRSARARVTQLVAPSLSARASFAVARGRRVECTLLDDLPSFRQLHECLDTAARALADAPFLANYRAPRAYLLRQEQEWALATHAQSASKAGATRVSRVHSWAPGAVRPLPLRLNSRTLTLDPRSPKVLLAGTSASRYGLEVLLRAVGPRSQVLVRKSEGSSALGLSDPRLRFTDDREPVCVRAVVAPAWVECQPVEVDAAVSSGVPVVATRFAAGWHTQGITFVEPGRVEQLRRALDAMA